MNKAAAAINTKKTDGVIVTDAVSSINHNASTLRNSTDSNNSNNNDSNNNRRNSEAVRRSSSNSNSNIVLSSKDHAPISPLRSNARHVFSASTITRGNRQPNA